MTVKVNPKLGVRNEYSKLKSVIVGTAQSAGGIPENPYDPKSKEYIAKGEYPKEADLIVELDSLADLLIKYGVDVYRPKVIQDYNQIFSRDIAFTIEDKLFISNMISDRSKEIEAIQDVIDQIEGKNIIEADEATRFEGGDIMPHNDLIFVGYSEPEDFNTYKVARTNRRGVDFISEVFPDKIVRPIELFKSDTNPRENALHLDCCFQPLGLGHCLIYKGGFKNEADYFEMKEIFGLDNCIDISQEEMYHMGSNVFSMDKNILISESGQTRINTKLRELGYTVEELNFKETSKMEGMFRCSTLPLWRE